MSGLRQAQEDRRSIVHPPHLQAAKVAQGALCDAFGKQEAVAQEVGRSQGRISAWCGRNTPDFMPLDAIDTIEDRIVGLPGWPHVTRWLARRRGLLLVPRPFLRPIGEWGRSLKLLTAEFGEVAYRVVAALGDADSPGEVTAAEIRRADFLAGLDELAEQVARMRAMAVHVLETEEEGG